MVSRRTSASCWLVRLAVSLVALTTASFPCSAAAGALAIASTATVRCARPFLLDGQMTTNTATAFTGSRIDDASGSCFIRRAAGGSLRMSPGSAVELSARGFLLLQGVVRMTGGSDLGIPGSSAVLKPDPPASVINSALRDGQWMLNVSAGAAEVAGADSEILARLGKGTLLTLTVNPSEASGLRLPIAGCLRSENDRWFLENEHVSQPVEMLSDKIRKEQQRVSAEGTLQPIPRGTQLAARLLVFGEEAILGHCSKFIPITNLTGFGQAISSGASVAQASSLAAGALATSAGAVAPGILSGSVSVP